MESLVTRLSSSDEPVAKDSVARLQVRTGTGMIEQFQPLYFAIAIENDRDSRDDLVAFSVIYHSCVAAYIDPTELFRKVAKLATPGVAKSMRDFVARSAADRSLSAFMLIKDVNSDGEVEIRPDWAGGA